MAEPSAASLVFSAIGGLFGTIVLVTAAPALAAVSLEFSSFEYVWLVLLGLTCAVFLSGGRALKGLVSLFIGLLIATVGFENPAAYPRFTFGSTQLMSGFQLIPVMIEQGRGEEEAALTLGASGWWTFWTVTLPNIRWALLYGVLLCNARAMGEFGAVAVVSGKIRGHTTTMPLMIEMLYNDYMAVAAFSMASLLALLGLVTLMLKSLLEWRYSDQLAARNRH